MTRRLFLALCGAMLPALGCDTTKRTHYRLTELADLDDSLGRLAINDSGHVLQGCRDGRARFYADGKTAVLQVPGKQLHVADLNNKGEVVGHFGAHRQGRPFIWKQGRFFDLGIAGGRTAAINDHSVVAGTLKRPDPDGAVRGGVSKAFTWSDGKVRLLPPLRGMFGGNSSDAVEINNRDQVVGYSFQTEPGGSAGSRAIVVWDGGAPTTLIGTMRGNVVRMLNDRGQVIGDQDGRSLFWQEWKFSHTRLPPLEEGPMVFPLSINDAGDIVGISGADKPVIWQADRVWDLNTLIIAGKEWHMHQARAINNRGQIVGYADRRNNRNRPVLLTPVS